MALFKELIVSTYVSPYVFWLINDNIEDKNNIQINLNKLLLEHEPEMNFDDNFEVGELVAVQLKGKLYRAILEYNQDSYLCWLIDYGTMVEGKILYKLPLHLRKIPALAFQACLNNVVFFREHLTYDEKAQAKIEKIPTTEPSPQARKISMNLLSNCKAVQFKLEDESDGIYFGDVLYKDDKNSLKSLKQELITSRVLEENELLFQNIRRSINFYREGHIFLINYTTHLSDLQLDIESSCKQLTFKYLDEFGDVDDMGENQKTSLRSINSSSSFSDSDQTFFSSIETFNQRKAQFNKNKEKTEERLATISKPKKLILEMKKKLNDSVSSDDSVSNRQNMVMNELSSMEEISQDNKTEKNKSDNDTSGQDDKEKKSIFADGFPFINKNEKTKLNQSKNVVFYPDKCYVNKKTNKTEKQNSTSQIDAVGTETESENMKTDSSSEDTSKNLNFDNTNKIIVKPKCNCSQCTIWTSESEPLSKCIDLKEKRIIQDTNKNVLFKTANKTKQANIVSLDYNNMTKIQKQSQQKILVHSECIPKPAKLISHVNFNKTVHENLVQHEYKEAKRIQAYSWPALLRNQHAFLINGPHSGKTLSYLPVICTFLLEKFERYSLTKTGGPVALILCSTSKKCEDIFLLTEMILGRNKSVALITSPINYGNVRRADLLITTPPVVVELLKNNVINFKRLCHFILEDTDRLIFKYNTIIKKLLNLIEDMLSNRVETKSVQLIICGEHWNAWTETMLKKLDKVPLICIGNYLEASLYGKMTFSMKFVNSACKEQELKLLLKDTYTVCKSVIICKQYEIEEVTLILMLKGINATIISEDLNPEDILYLEEVWTNNKGGEYTVLVCTDFCLNTVLTVTSASQLIHYSLPSSWTKFVKRFSCLLESLHSPLQTSKINNCQSVILCDENCEEQMHKFFCYINASDLKHKLPEKINKFSEGLKHLEEEKKVKKKIRLCDNIKLFGICTEFYCEKRHILVDNLDVVDFLPESGKIKFQIIDIQNVTSFAIKPIDYIDKRNRTHIFSNLIDITEAVTDTLRISRRRALDPMLGHYYIYFIATEDIYYRCEIIDIDGNHIKMFLIDKGTVIIETKPELYALPKEFNIQDYPPAAIESYIANFIPKYQDETFSFEAFSKLKFKLEENDYKNKTFVAEIRLKLGCTLWLQNICEEIILSDSVIMGQQLSRELTCLQLAEYNAQQLIRLYQLCEKANISVPKIDITKVQCDTNENKAEIRWAFLDVSNVNEVIFCAAVSPDEFYVRLFKYNHLLFMLQRDIQESIKKPNYPKLKNIKPGVICLAKDSEDLEYCRVIVVKVQDDQALCFFVDFGDESVIPLKELLFITDKLLQQLPFQSIKCKLYGLKPILNGWNPDIVSVLYEYSMEPQTDIFRSLYVKVVDKEASIQHNTKYSVLLKDGFGQKNVLINQLIIDCGLAVPTSEEIDDFELPPIQYETDDENDTDNNESYNTFPSPFVNESNFEEMEFFVEDAPKFIKEFVIKSTEDPEKKTVKPSKESEKKQTQQLPIIMPPTPVDYLTPEVFWYQTETTVRISIRLIDIGYKISLTKGRFLHFSCSKNLYKLKLMLYEKIESMQHTSVGLDIRITLTKLRSLEWPRLIVPKQKPLNIHFDASMLNFKEEHRKILELPKELDEESSEDEPDKDDVKYFVFSDLDSDLDQDIPQDSD